MAGIVDRIDPCTPTAGCSGSQYGIGAAVMDAATVTQMSAVMRVVDMSVSFRSSGSSGGACQLAKRYSATRSMWARKCSSTASGASICGQCPMLSSSITTSGLGMTSR